MDTILGIRLQCNGDYNRRSEGQRRDPLSKAGSLVAVCMVALFWVAFPVPAYSGVPAFPGAEGSGALAKGGRGGVLCEVTNLNDSGPGSLRSCVEKSGPRTVVFRTSGTIVLRSRLRIRNPYITIAGQTAPGGGIQLTFKEPGTIPDDGCPFPRDEWNRWPAACPENGTPGPTWRENLNNQRPIIFEIETHDVILRYLRVRPGYVGHCPACPGTGIADPILIGNMSALSGRHHVENIILDHLSVMWGSNVNLRIYDLTGERRVQNISIQNSIFAETLYGRPLMAIGSDVHTYPTAGARMGNIDLHRNILSTSFGRVPLFPHGRGFSGPGRYINNISYNTRNTMARVNQDIEYDTPMDYIGNIFDHGPVFNDSGRGCHEIGIAQNRNGRQPTAYVAGNWGDRHGYDNYNMLGFPPSGGGADCGRGPAPEAYRRNSPNPSPLIPVTIVNVDNLEDHLLPVVGASRRLDCKGAWVFNRDAADSRVVEEGYRKRAQDFLVAHEEQVGGFPVIEEGEPCGDSSGDGIPDAWLIRNGLNPEQSIGTRFHETGYTYLELYLNGMQLTARPQLAPSAAPTSVLVQ